MNSMHNPRPLAPAQFTRQDMKLQPSERAQVQGHTDLIHDTQFDFYGQLLATASSDRSIGIHLIREGQPIQRIASLTGHQGPVWAVDWAHPRFGHVLASASFDQKAIIWKDVMGRWNPVHVVDIHQESVNSVAWGPEELGLLLATASSDGTVAVTAFRDGFWQESIKLSSNNNKITHAMGAMCVSFVPVMADFGDEFILASGGCDCQVRLWTNDKTLSRTFKLFQVVEGHSDWVLDVAFCKISASSRFAMFASCGKDKQIVIYRKPWEQLYLELSDPSVAQLSWENSVVVMDEAVWRLSWAPSGQILVATTASSQVFILQEGSDFIEPWIVTPLEDYQRE
ncbi:unnamed protein product [Phytomonas sp. Hart1]|nr:unnamed protein product [Phytomonas sp. Hart1]|eukprot:CCW70506.1 unnamed protein product [Phytomonas sp. isolate Hart1]